MDILPPGNTPAWADSTPANEIAQLWANEMWPALWQRMRHPYADTAARDADLAGLGPTDTAYAYTLDTDTHWSWNGTTWVAAAATSSVGLSPTAGQYTATAGYSPTARIVTVAGVSRVEVHGAVTKSVGATSPTLTTLPVGYRPASGNRWLGVGVSSGGDVYELLVQPSGAIGFVSGYATGSIGDGDVVPIHGSFTI